MGKWRANSPGSCPYHGPHRLDRLHDTVCRQVIDVVRAVDPSVCLLPEFPVGLKHRGADGRFRAGPSHTVDLLVVLSNDQLAVIEVDGDSHRGDAVTRDIYKDKLLAICKVPCHRLRFDAGSVSCSSLALEYDKVRVFVEQYM